MCLTCTAASLALDCEVRSRHPMHAKRHFMSPPPWFRFCWHSPGPACPGWNRYRSSDARASSRICRGQSPVAEDAVLSRGTISRRAPGIARGEIRRRRRRRRGWEPSARLLHATCPSSGRSWTYSYFSRQAPRPRSQERTSSAAFASSVGKRRPCHGL